MNVRFSSQRHRFFLHHLLTIASFVFPLVATAGDVDCGSNILPHERFATLCELRWTERDELCGWTEPGTHDSVALPAPATQTSNSSLGASVSAIAAVACASAGVSVEQMIEPFAMVGPYLDNSLEAIRKFESWWDEAVSQGQAMQAADAEARLVDAGEIQDQLDAIAAEEPVDVESLGESVLVDSFGTQAVDGLEPGVYVTAIDMLVGGSPIIATIEQDYLPYDLSARDIKLWSVFPISTHPFCIRSRAEEFDSSPMWREFDEQVRIESDAQGTGDAYAYCGSAYCLLDELIWRVETSVAEDSPLWIAVEPRNIGSRLASVAAGSDRLVKGVAHLLASHWPEAEEQIDASPSGAALLARAGAIEASEPVESIAPSWTVDAGTQIAEAPSATALR